MRIRVGIDRPQNKEDVVNYVLEKLWKEEKELILSKKEEVFEIVDDFANN